MWTTGKVESVTLSNGLTALQAKGSGSTTCSTKCTTLGSRRAAACQSQAKKSFAVALASLGKFDLFWCSRCKKISNQKPLQILERECGHGLVLIHDTTQPHNHTTCTLHAYSYSLYNRQPHAVCMGFCLFVWVSMPAMMMIYWIKLNCLTAQNVIL